MKKELLVMAILLTLGLLVTGCGNTEKLADAQNTVETGSVVSNNPDTYVDEQLVDENQTIEIGEMI
jgi:hypothetical protein